MNIFMQPIGLSPINEEQIRGRAIRQELPDSQGPAPHPLDDTDEPDAQRRETAAETEEAAAQREAME